MSKPLQNRFKTTFPQSKSWQKNNNFPKKAALILASDHSDVNHPISHEQISSPPSKFTNFQTDFYIRTGR